MIGAALGTAILPQVSRHVDIGEADKAARVQGQAAELAMLLCLPAALALAVSALPARLGDVRGRAVHRQRRALSRR